MEITKDEIALFISGRKHFKTVIKDKEGYYYIMIKGLINEEEITIKNSYALNTRAPQYNNILFYIPIYIYLKYIYIYTYIYIYIYIYICMYV